MLNLDRMTAAPDFGATARDDHAATSVVENAASAPGAYGFSAVFDAASSASGPPETADPEPMPRKRGATGERPDPADAAEAACVPVAPSPIVLTLPPELMTATAGAPLSRSASDGAVADATPVGKALPLAGDTVAATMPQDLPAVSQSVTARSASDSSAIDSAAIAATDAGQPAAAQIAGEAVFTLRNLPAPAKGSTAPAAPSPRRDAMAESVDRAGATDAAQPGTNEAVPGAANPDADAGQDQSSLADGAANAVQQGHADVADDLFGYLLANGSHRPDAGAPPLQAIRHAVASLPPHLGAQLTASATGLADAPVEIAFAPSELGTMRLLLSREGDGLSIVVTADRPEMLGLLRRNINSLAQDFRDLGFQTLSFSFQNDNGGGTAAKDTPLLPEDAATIVTPSASDHPAPYIPTPMAAEGGLDLRL